MGKYYWDADISAGGFFTSVRWLPAWVPALVAQRSTRFDEFHYLEYPISRSSTSAFEHGPIGEVGISAHVSCDTIADSLKLVADQNI